MGERRLGLDATLRLAPGRRGLALRVNEGCVLVTQQGDELDHVLEAGDEVRLPGRGVVVAWALTPSRVAVGEALQAPARRDGREVAPARA
jgi:hypothetical protein